MKKLISTLAVVSALVPSLGHAAIFPEDVVASILGTRMPPSEVRVGTSMKPLSNTVHFFDNLINVTNRVLDRSIRADIVRIHTNMQNGEIYTNAAMRNKANLETHCVSRLNADGVTNVNVVEACSM